jgi:hypothetical protein
VVHASWVHGQVHQGASAAQTVADALPCLVDLFLVGEGQPRTSCSQGGEARLDRARQHAVIVVHHCHRVGTLACRPQIAVPRSCAPLISFSKLVSMVASTPNEAKTFFQAGLTDFGQMTTKGRFICLAIHVAA